MSLSTSAVIERCLASSVTCIVTCCNLFLLEFFVCMEAFADLKQVWVQGARVLSRLHRPGNLRDHR